MSAGTVTFANNTLMTPALGVFDFIPGMFERKKVYSFLPRSGVIPKDMGRGSATHKVHLKYLNVLPGNIAGIFSDLEAIYDPVTGTPPPTGRLIVTTASGDYRNLNHCICDTIEAGAQKRVAINITPQNPEGDEAYNLEFNLTFIQTRR